DRSRVVSRALAVFVLVRRLGYRVADVAATIRRDGATTTILVGRLGLRAPSDGRGHSRGRAIVQVYGSQGLTPHFGDAAELDVLVAADGLGEARKLERASVSVGRRVVKGPPDEPPIPRNETPLLAPDPRVPEWVVGRAAEPPQR